MGAVITCDRWPPSSWLTVRLIAVIYTSLLLCDGVATLRILFVCRETTSWPVGLKRRSEIWEDAEMTLSSLNIHASVF